MTDLELILQPSKKIKMKLVLLDAAYTVSNEITGDILSFAMKIDANSPIRRTASVGLFISNAEYLAASFSKLWLNQMIRAHFGIYDHDTSDYRWFLIGSFIISKNAYTYSATAQQLDLSLIDMMGAAVEDRGSQIGSAVEILVGANIKSAIEATLARFSPYNNRNVCNFSDTVPYDLEFNSGSYPYEVLSKLVQLYPCYQQYYTTDGVYTVNLIPTGMGQPIVMNANAMQKIVISEDGDVDYKDIKNTTEIWGQSLDAVYTASSCVSVGSQYRLMISSDFAVLEEGATYSFTPDADCMGGQTVKIGSTTAYPLYTETGAGVTSLITSRAMLRDKHYVIKYSNEKFILQGESYIHAMCMEYNISPSDATIEALKSTYGCDDIAIVVNGESPFAVDHISDNNGQPIGVINHVLSDGDYEAINTTELALERAKYENWKTTRLSDSIQLKCLYVPWLDVNQKIAYTSIISGETHQYMINGIDVSLSDFTMTLDLMRFYSYYPWDVSSDNYIVWRDLQNSTWGSQSALTWRDYFSRQSGDDNTNQMTWGDLTSSSWGAQNTTTWRERALPQNESI